MSYLPLITYFNKATQRLGLQSWKIVEFGVAVLFYELPPPTQSICTNEYTGSYHASAWSQHMVQEQFKVFKLQRVNILSLEVKAQNYLFSQSQRLLFSYPKKKSMSLFIDHSQGSHLSLLYLCSCRQIDASMYHLMIIFSSAPHLSWAVPFLLPRSPYLSTHFTFLLPGIFLLFYSSNYL